MSEPTPTDPLDVPDPDDLPDAGARPSPGASGPGEPGYDGEVTVGDDGFEGLPEPEDETGSGS